jgi:hypothetical protein
MVGEGRIASGRHEWRLRGHRLGRSAQVPGGSGEEELIVAAARTRSRTPSSPTTRSSWANGIANLVAPALTLLRFTEPAWPNAHASLAAN